MDLLRYGLRFRGGLLVLIVVASSALSLAGCSTDDGSCGGDGCASASCSPGETECTDDRTLLVCGSSGSSVTQRSCAASTHCASVGDGGYACVLDADASAVDAAADASAEDGSAEDGSSVDASPVDASDVADGAGADL